MTERIAELNRKEFAVSLRQAGLVGVDFEDWDGLSDPQVVGLVQYMHQVQVDSELIQEHSHEV